MVEALHRHARHQKPLEDAVGNQLDPLALRSFFVVAVVAAQLHAAERGKRGIVFYAEESRQHRMTDHLGERLALVVSALALALQAMADHLMEENRGRPAR